MFHAAVVADRDQHAARAGFQMGGFDLGLVIQIELLQSLLFTLGPAAIDVFRNGEDEEQN